MRPRFAATLVLTFCLFGCSSVVSPGVKVELLTRGDPRLNACYTNSASGPLVADPTYGTAIIDGDVQSTTPVPVMWRVGFTGRRAGSEIEVLDPDGNVVAKTGRSYTIEGGYVGDPRAFWSCGSVREL